MIGSIRVGGIPTREGMDGNGFCDVGLATQRGCYGDNEDFCMAAIRDDDVVLALADGIGSEPFGRALGRLACLRSIESFAEGSSGEKAFELASREVRSFLRDARSPKSGTTLMLAEVNESRLHLWWEGDGECLHIRGGRCREISRRHRLEASPMLTRSVGADMTIRPSFAEATLRSGDKLVLLTDGVADSLGRARMMSMFYTEGSASRCAKRLVSSARAIGSDDATAAVVTIL